MKGGTTSLFMIFSHETALKNGWAFIYSAVESLFDGSFSRRLVKRCNKLLSLIWEKSGSESIKIELIARNQNYIRFRKQDASYLLN